MTLDAEPWFAIESVGIALVDRQLCFLRVNETLATWNGTSASAHIGRTVAEMSPPAIAGQVTPWCKAVLQTQKPLLGQTTEVGDRHGFIDIVPAADGLLIAIVDTSTLRQTERALLARLRLSEFVGEVSAGFIDLPASKIEQGIDSALASIAQALEVDRSYIGIFSDARDAFSIPYLWARDSAEVGRRFASPLPISQFPIVNARLLEGHDFLFNAFEELPPGAIEERQGFGASGVKALVIMPLRIGREIIGFVGFSCTRSQRQWTSEVLSIMRITVEIIANALDRKRREDALVDRREFEALLANLSRNFINAPLAESDTVMVEALRMAGLALQFERAAVYLRDDSVKWLNLAYEWRVQDMPSLRPEFSEWRLDQVGWRPSEFDRGQAFMLYAEQWPAEALLAQRLIKHSGLQLFGCAPLVSGGRNFGTLALYSRHRPKLTEDFISRLTLVGEWVASALGRITAERAREKAYDELQALKSRIEGERDYLREEIRNERQGDDFLGRSEAIRATVAAIAAVAPTQASVLVRGESGVGKELIARAIHERSQRADGPLVRVNCASIPRELFESEFFGHVRGAFTGAQKDRAGRFELASGGSLFLDEIGEIPIDLQAKLLRVLQEGEFERVGDERTRTTDVRVIAATNRDLEADIAAGHFRRDLYYRLCTFPIDVPPLRDRDDDSIVLARHFLEAYARGAGRPPLTLTAEDVRLLRAYQWPGNVRELQHVLERAVILSSGNILRLDLALPRVSIEAAPKAATLDKAPVPMAEMKQRERDNIVAALEKTRWRVAGAGGAAAMLGLKPSTLRDKMRGFGISR